MVRVCAFQLPSTLNLLSSSCRSDHSFMQVTSLSLTMEIIYCHPLWPSLAPSVNTALGRHQNSPVPSTLLPHPSPSLLSFLFFLLFSLFLCLLFYLPPSLPSLFPPFPKVLLLMHCFFLLSYVCVVCIFSRLWYMPYPCVLVHVEA